MDPKPDQGDTAASKADDTDSRLGLGKKPKESPEASPEVKSDNVDARFEAMQLEPPSQDDLFSYKMNYKNRGLFYIINNKKFDPRTGMNERSGTDADAANLYQRFKELGFDIKIYKDISSVQMLKLMADAAKIDHSNNDCFGCAILSHGDDGVVYGTDGIIQVDMLVAPFKGDQCPTLIGKPKLFFLQACRGNQLDHGVELQADADTEPEQKVYRIPSEADFLYAYSTVPGYFSWRNSTKGSWFVQALCQILKEYGHKKDLLWIMTRVNYVVAYEFQSNASKEFMNRKKQIPSVVSMLTKEVVFTPKK